MLPYSVAREMDPVELDSLLAGGSSMVCVVPHAAAPPVVSTTIAAIAAARRRAPCRRKLSDTPLRLRLIPAMMTPLTVTRVGACRHMSAHRPSYGLRIGTATEGARYGSLPDDAIPGDFDGGMRLSYFFP